MTALHLVVPGPLDQRTGGSRYDARMVSGLRARGWDVTVHELEGRFPDADTVGRESLAAALESVPEGVTVVVDGLVLGGLPEVARDHAERVALLALVHHPLADETGLVPDAAERFRASEAEALAAVQGVVVSSAFTARRLDGYGVPEDRIRVVIPGTEPPGWTREPGAQKPRREPAADRDDAPRLLCVASVTPRKGQDVLIHALSGLQELPWSCVLVGSMARDPRYAARVEAAVAAYGLARRVRLAGEVDEAALEVHFREADLFVFPSHYEGYGMALTEALARGIPVVTTTGGAIPDTVPRKAGVLVPPGDVTALAGALRLLLSDGEVREAYAAAARDHAGKLPDWDQQAAAFGQAVEELVRHV